VRGLLASAKPARNIADISMHEFRRQLGTMPGYTVRNW
jgi:hypothetical protein